jgi:sugar phosphate isomerase/epimerase
MMEVLDSLDKNWIGIYLDPAHSVIEGGKNGWNFSLRQVLDRVTMVGIKDFVWEKVDGKWRTRWVPLGQGMVPFDEVFAILATTSFPGPISLHLEYYEPTGRTKAARLENSVAALEKDVKFLREAIRKASART